MFEALDVCVKTFFQPTFSNGCAMVPKIKDFDHYAVDVFANLLKKSIFRYLDV